MTPTTSAARLREALERCLRANHPEVDRLSYADTRVTFDVLGDDDPVTLLLDRMPPRLAGPGERADIQIRFTEGEADAFMAGTLCVPAALMTGQLTSQGPVRRYLEIDPILRGLLASIARAGSPNGAGETVAAMGGVRSNENVNLDLLAIETRGLHKSFGANQVLTGVDLAIPEGLISVVLGPSGTGKSVLLQHVIGLLAPDSGEVLIRGRSLDRMSRAELLWLRTEIGVMFQDGALFSTMNVYDNVAFPLRQHTDMGEDEIRDVVMQHLDNVGLLRAADRLPSQLSGGMRKRAGLARALVLDPGIVLCDEPDSGLDPVRTSLLGDLLVEEHERSGGTMLVITHDVSLAKRISEHISVLWQGKVLEAGISEEILASDTEFVRQFLAGATKGPLSMDA
jgi:phospholipid/cholesterol/gamma-HCH transport system ATP-binding protein